jgi:cardiolipin synthase A/B
MPIARTFGVAASSTILRIPSWRSSFFRAHRMLVAIAVSLVVAVGLGVGVSLWRRAEVEPFRMEGAVAATGPELANALYQSLGVELRPGHDVRLVDNGTVFDALDDEIRRATKSVHVDIFIWQKGAASDRMISAVTDRARAGITCRILVDHVGSPGFDEDVRPPLERAGCEVRVFRRAGRTPDVAARNHRKIVVVDGRVAFTGGFAIRDEWLGDGVTNDAWRDANVRFTGPAVAYAQQAIAENWQEAGGALFPADTFPPADAGGATRAVFVGSTASPVLARAERLVQLFVTAAQKRLWIANAYFVPPKGLIERIKAKARAGVDVRLLLPGKKSDSKISMGSQHIAYGSLVEAGVRVFEYQPSMMHAKTMVADDDLAMVSTINLEPLSFAKLEEDALVVSDASFTADLAHRFEADCVHARPVGH